NSQSPNKKPAMPFRKAPTSIDAMPMTTTPSSATSVQKINFSAAWVALPLCFMPAILIGGGGEGKEDICQEGARGRRTEFFETKPQRTQRTQRGEAATKDRGRESSFTAPPPSKPDRRISRIRLSS